MLSIAHSYVVALNRRIAHEILRESGGSWEVTVVAPHEMRGDLRPTAFEPMSHEPCRVEVVRVRWPERIHCMLYSSRLRHILAEPWNLIHCWEEPFTAAGAQVAFHTKKTPLVFYTFQNLSKRYPPPFAHMESYAVTKSAGWIAAGKEVEATLLQSTAGYREKPHRVLPLGVDMSVFRRDPAARAIIMQKLGWVQTGPPVVGFLGRFVPEKGLRLLTRAVDGVRVEWRAVFIGSGPEESFLRQWAAKYRERVRIITNVHHSEVPAYLNAVDILCAPSQTARHWREQFGRMLIEAFATEVAVIGSDSGEIPHVMGDAGLVVGENEEAGWARAISELLDDPARRDELAKRGLQRARELFSWPVIARQHVEFFEELMASGYPHDSGLR